MVKDTIGWWAEQYVRWLQERNYSPRTVEQRQAFLANFAAFCEARNLLYPQEVTRAVIDRYQSMLYHHRRPDGRPLSFQAQATRLTSLKMYFRWLARQRVIALSPASEIELPKLTKQLPRTVLTALEAEAVLRVPDVDDVLGLRDRAMMEVLYATAVRRAELIALRIYDVDRERCTLMVREGKGRRDRVVPLGERALAWVDKYLEQARPELATALDDGALFLSNTGEALSRDHLSSLVRGYVDRAELGKSGACHIFRHTAATLMLENGADIRFIQQLLGHAKLDTTSIYTQVSIHKLKQVHALTHPGARLRPVQSDDLRKGDFSLAAASETDGTALADSVERLHEELEAEAEAEPEGDDLVEPPWQPTSSR